MKKIDKVILGIYIIIGIILLIIGVTTQIDYYSSLIFAMGAALACSGIMQFIRFYHNTKPENIKSYHEKMRRQAINLKDERKVQLRNRAGYITWAATMILCFTGAFIAALFRAGALIVCSLAGAAAVQYVLATIIYKYLCSKM
ncbi:MAG: hypothetical protein Q4F83_01265 [Eubacteriales bacterium]|nr:hypothetical protein [Eubacteriales bacterium]